MQHQFGAIKCGPLKLDELRKRMDIFEENKMSPKFRIVPKVSCKIAKIAGFVTEVYTRVDVDLNISAKVEPEIEAMHIIKMGKTIVRVDVIFTDNDVVMIQTKPIN